MKTSALTFKLFGYWFSFRISVYRSLALTIKGIRKNEDNII